MRTFEYKYLDGGKKSKFRKERQMEGRLLTYPV